MVSFAVHDYLATSAVWAGEHFDSFCHLQDSDPAQLPFSEWITITCYTLPDLLS